jgi:hypothetical protein
MEISRHQTSKNLHHHALPIVIIVIAVLVVSTPFVLKQNSLSGNGTALVHDLSTHTLQITSTSNGLAQVTLNHNSPPHINSEVSQAGRTPELIFTLDQ